MSECLAEAQAAGTIAADLDIRECAEFLLNSWQGAILRAKTTRSVEPLRLFLRMTILRLERS